MKLNKRLQLLSSGTASGLHLSRHAWLPVLQTRGWLNKTARVFILFMSLALITSEAKAESANSRLPKGYKPPSEQIFRAIYPVAPKTLDPHAYNNPAAWPVIMAAYDRLMSFKNGTAEPSPSLVETVRVSTDGRQYTFVLKSNYSFADGSPMNSEAVLYSFDRLMASSIGRQYYPYLKRFEIIGPYSFRFILERPWPPFLASLALPPASLVSPGLTKKPHDYLVTRSLGSGRYQVDDWKGDTIGLKARADLLSQSKLNFIMFHYEADGRERYEKAAANSAHLVIEPLLPQEALSAQYQIKLVPTFSARYLAINTRRPYVSNRSVRRAIGFLLDDAFRGHPGTFSGFFPGGLFFNAPPAPPQPQITDQLAHGRAILKEAGSPPSPLRLLYRQPDAEAPADISVITEALQSAGVTLLPLGLEERELRQALEGGNYDLFLDVRAPDIPAPDMWLGRFMDSTSSADGNPAYFSNRQADQLIDEIVNAAGREGDGPGDLSRLKKWQADKLSELADLASLERPYIFLYSPQRRMMIDVRLSGSLPHPQWPEVWPLDQAELKPFSFRSGANPSGRPPVNKNMPERQKPKLTPLVAPKGPSKPSSVPLAPSSPPAAKEQVGEPRLKFLERGDFSGNRGPAKPAPGDENHIATEID